MIKFFIDNWKYIVIILGIAIVAALGSLIVSLGLDWFQTLTKPSNFVPSFIIPIAWSIIYTAFTIILCLWVKKENLKKDTIILLILNGLLNVLWCLFFFTFKNTLLGLVTIIINLILAILLTINIYKTKPVYSYILSIYPLWLSIATCLNLSTWILN